MSCCAPGETSEADRRSESIPSLVRVVVVSALAGQAMLLSLVLNVGEMAPNERAFFFVFLGALVVLAFELVGGPLVSSVGRAIAARELRFELLFASAIAGALGLSAVAIARGADAVYLDVVVILLALHAAGKRVSGVERRRSLAAVRALRDEEDVCAVRSHDGTVNRVPVRAIRAGQIVVAHPGERLALDGTVAEGEAFVREAPITGEPFEVPKRTGDRVLAGTVVVDATVHVRVSAALGERELDRIADAVESARERPASLERTADRFARWLLPTVIVVAAATLAGWGFARDLETGAIHAMSVLLVACPCAMGFAIPLTVAGALGALARQGIHLRGGDALERLARVDAVALDKTGTLTRGDARAIEVAFADDDRYEERSLRALVGAVERASTHPIARTLERLGDPSGRFVVDFLRVIPAVGLEASVRDIADGVRLRVELGVDDRPEDAPHLSELTARLAYGDARLVRVRLESKLVGLVAVRELPRDGAGGLVEALGELGLRVRVLTGDRARSLGPDVEVHGALTPGDKAEHIRAMRREGRTVLFVGDGINDGAAMAESDVVLAPEDGTRLARDLAHGVFRERALGHLPRAIASSRAAVRSLRSSLAYAAAYNAVGMSVAAAGLLHPVAAAVLMVASSLFVTSRASAFVSSASQPRARRLHDRGGGEGTVEALEGFGEEAALVRGDLQKCERLREVVGRERADAAVHQRDQ